MCVLKYGYGQHRKDLPPATATSPEPLILFYANQIIFKLTTGLCKISLCMVYQGLFPFSGGPLIRRTRYIVEFTLYLVIGAYGSAFLISIFQCTPVSKTWHSKEHGSCINLVQFRMSTAVFNIVTSLLVICTPLPALWQMKDKRPEVKQLLVLILLGLVHTGCTITRFVIMFYPDPSAKNDPQWGNNTANAISMVEMNVGLAAAALVVMRPAFQAVYNLTISPFVQLRSHASSDEPSTKTSGVQIPSYLARSWERHREKERERKRKSRRHNEISTFDIGTAYADEATVGTESTHVATWGNTETSTETCLSKE